jgi:D-alanyl-D-alanine dipeptidase
MRRAVLVVAWLGLGGRARADRPDDFVDVGKAIPDAVIDMRYATADNFVGQQLYPVARCVLRRAVVERLARAAKALRAKDRRLLVWDCYRPSSIQLVLWKKVPDPRYVADPKQGSRHSRGAAIDVGLVAADGKPVELPTAFDDFTPAAHRDRALPRSAEARLLASAMTEAGFVGMPTEWWHFDAPDTYPLSDAPL